MIISKTPFRISFVGGGTDIDVFYKRESGAVVSAAIDKFMYVTLNKSFEDKIRVAYSRTEIVDSLDELKHELVRESMRLCGVKNGVEITTIADVPSRGTGLGSSSSLTVGLLNALHFFRGNRKTAKELAEDACKIEIGVVREPIGKQDQFIAAFGGLRFIEFNSDESVKVTPIKLSGSTQRKLQENLLLFFTGQTRKASEILSEQKKNVELSREKFEALSRMKALAVEMRNSLQKNSVEKVGELLHENWKLKKTLASGISNEGIEKFYGTALNAGASGGKILGAGGGGFLLLFVPKENQEKVRGTLNLKELKFGFESEGSRIILDERKQ